MDFDDTPDEAAFRAEARAFLDANAERRKPGAGGGLPARPGRAGRAGAAKAFQAQEVRRRLRRHRLAEGVGRPGRQPIQQVIYNQEEAKYDVPAACSSIGLGMCIPTICACGTQEQRDRFVAPALRGEEIWCQLFSEPAAGSDLAALRTAAERDGDEWVVNGQKIWTSGAHYARLRHRCSRAPIPTCRSTRG